MDTPSSRSLYLLCLCLSLFVSPWFPQVSGDACTLACDALFPISPFPVRICGTDGEDHVVPLSALAGLPPPWSCYRDCGVEVRYPGTCECPNDCSSRSNKGKCGDKGCICQDGWGGADCSAINCPNTCSNNGECNKHHKSQDECVCNEGFTGADCSIATLDIPTLPYGDVLPGKMFYDDKYGDAHPIFNISVIGKIDLSMDDSDYNDMLAPVNTWNQSYFKVSGTFSNGNIKFDFDKAGIKIKGNWNRMSAKKSFKVRFDKKSKKGNFFGLSQIALKAPALDPSYVHNQIVAEFYRAMIVPATRGSFGTVTINGVFWGLYWLSEQLDENFALSRYGSDAGNMYALNTYLEYLGDDGEAYANLTRPDNGSIMNVYKVEFGDGTFDDFALFSKFINQTTDEEFQNQIESTLNVDNFIRSMVVESSYDDADGYLRNGNNWVLFNCKVNNTWQYLSKDYELAMTVAFRDAYEMVSGNTKALLAHRVMTIPKYHDIFNSYYTTFLEKVYDPSLPSSATKRIRAMHTFLQTIVSQDEFYRVTTGFPSDEATWSLFIDESIAYLDLQYLSLKKQFP